MRSKRLTAVVFSLLVAFAAAIPLPVGAVETWEKLDKRLKGQIFQLNLGLKLRLKDQYWCHLADLSPKYRFPVFSTTTQDRGFRVIGFGSSFPVRTAQKGKTYFLTSHHVIDSSLSDPLIKECERFYAAMRLYAEQTAGGKDHDARFNELMQIVNLSTKPGLAGNERAVYQQTVDAIWDTYEKYLSMKADPARALFKKYSALARVESQLGYFLHAPGPVTQPPLEATVYKSRKDKGDPDLAVLSVNATNLIGLELDFLAPTEGQEIQVIGYPTASDQIDTEAEKYYAPTFSTGRISRVAPNLLQVDAPITTGNSGSPVVSLRGKVLGVIARRAISRTVGGELPNFAGAVTVQSIQSFAPELFGKVLSKN
ncbi:MAG TPA: serine protease [Candidatus Obscuribacterales bacterium]